VHAGEFSSGEVVPGTRYRVVGLVGRGGMGLVYDVEHVELGKRFVLKALLGDHVGRDDLVARLRNEQRALGRLEHPNIVAVTDAGVTSTNVPYFVMERLEGETLGARLRRERKLSVVEAIAVASGVLEGLSAAHEIGVVHRDIKPQNIFVLAGNRAKILDFGVAKIADAGSVITKRGVALGTPRYMSPEQVGGEPIDGRSDLYAVGLVLFEAIAGRGPFDDVRDASDMLVAHLRRTAPALGSAVGGVSRELDALVASLLAKKPDARPPTARAAAAALANLLARYGGASKLDAPTPPASHSTSKRTVLQPGGPASALATRPDGVALYEAARQASSSSTNGTTQPMLHAATGTGTTFDVARAPGGTLYDPSSRALTVAQSQARIPVDAFRTERLETAGPSNAFTDDPTHTRVPPTPSEGTLSLAPVPLDGPRSRRGRPLVVGGAVGLGAVLIGGYFLLGSPRSEPPGERRDEAVVTATRSEPAESSRPAAAPVPSPTARASIASPPVLGVSPPVASAAVGSVERPPLSGRAPVPRRARDESAPSPSSRPTPAASQKAEPRAEPSALPRGLPQSGL
jgi:serine/threonine protein kinase